MKKIRAAKLGVGRSRFSHTRLFYKRLFCTRLFCTRLFWGLLTTRKLPGAREGLMAAAIDTACR